jgi:hypothetical protein
MQTGGRKKQHPTQHVNWEKGKMRTERKKKNRIPAQHVKKENRREGKTARQPPERREGKNANGRKKKTAPPAAREKGKMQTGRKKKNRTPKEKRKPPRKGKNRTAATHMARWFAKLLLKPRITFSDRKPFQVSLNSRSEVTNMAHKVAHPR